MIQTGWVKLHEFHVDHTTTRAPRHGDAITRIAVGIGGHFIHLACTARCQHTETRLYRINLMGGAILHIHAVAARIFAFLLNQAFVFVGNQINRYAVLKHLDICTLTHPLRQHGLHRMTRKVIHMHHTAVAVSAFAGQMQLAIFSIELNPLCHEPFD